MIDHYVSITCDLCETTIKQLFSDASEARRTVREIGWRCRSGPPSARKTRMDYCTECAAEDSTFRKPQRAGEVVGWLGGLGKTTVIEKPGHKERP